MVAMYIRPSSKANFFMFKPLKQNFFFNKETILLISQKTLSSNYKKKKQKFLINIFFHFALA